MTSAVQGYIYGHCKSYLYSTIRAQLRPYTVVRRRKKRTTRQCHRTTRTRATRSEFPTHVAGVLRSPGPPPVGKYARPVENARVTVRDASTALAGACACACARVRRHISAASFSRTIETDNVGQRAGTIYCCVVISSRAVRLIKTLNDASAVYIIVVAAAVFVFAVGIFARTTTTTTGKWRSRSSRPPPPPRR